MSHKKEIEQILKSKGLGFIKITTPGSWGDRKVFKNSAGKSFKGIEGSSIGPMTSTNIYLEKNQKIQKELQDLLSPIVNEILTTPSGFSIIFELTPGRFRGVDFRWSLFPTNTKSCNFDPSYETYWLVAETKDFK